MSGALEFEDFLLEAEKPLEQMEALYPNPAMTTTLNDMKMSENESDFSMEQKEESMGPLNFAPTEVLINIFRFLELKDRVRVSSTCSRWHVILNDHVSPLDQVVVFNVFEENIWKTSSCRKATNRIDTFHAKNMKDFGSICQHVSASSSVKLWYSDPEVAREVVDVLADKKVQMKCLDVFPYGESLIFDEIHEKLPALGGLTMRPHGVKYFYNGMPLTSFPMFEQLTTLVIDTFNIGEEVCLPPLLKTLEFSIRQELVYLDFIDKMTHLKYLEYFSLTHANLSKQEDFERLLRVISKENMPKLSLMILHFCKFANRSDKAHEERNLENCLKRLGNGIELAACLLKLDLCYGCLECVARSLMNISPKITIMSINVIASTETLRDVFNLSDFMLSKKITLHFGILERDRVQFTRRFAASRLTPAEDPIPNAPSSFYALLTKFEASFCESSKWMGPIISNALPVLQEAKFIQCHALTDEMITNIAQTSKIVRKLTIISCKQVSPDGVLSFLENFEFRKSRRLLITWSPMPKLVHPANIYLNLVHDQPHLLKGKKARFISRSFTEDSGGEEIRIWDKEGKVFSLRDYGAQEALRIIGVVVPSKSISLEEEDLEKETPPTPPSSDSIPDED